MTNKDWTGKAVEYNDQVVFNIHGIGRVFDTAVQGYRVKTEYSKIIFFFEYEVRLLSEDEEALLVLADKL